MRCSARLLNDGSVGQGGGLLDHHNAVSDCEAQGTAISLLDAILSVIATFTVTIMNAWLTRSQASLGSSSGAMGAERFGCWPSDMAGS
jgi:hypothetical protein